MNKFCWVLLLFVVFAGQAMAIDVSPTQTTQKPQPKVMVSISQDLVDAILADKALADGIEMLCLDQCGKAICSLMGNLSKPLSGKPEDAARAYLYDHCSLFNLPETKNPDVVKLVKSTNEACADHVSFQMTLDGVPVRDALIEVHIGKNHSVGLVNGCFPTIKAVSNNVVIDRAKAIEAAKKSLNTKALRNPAKAELELLPRDDMGTLVYRVELPVKEPLGDWEILIDAQTGKEISRQNQMVFATGNGSVYPFNPLVGGVSKKPLPHLTAHTLKGAYANVLNEDFDEALSETDEHHYSPDDTHFDEVNIYYFINKVHDFYKGLGHSKMDKPLKATVHVKTNYDNAYYSPYEDAMAFGDGNKLNDLSKEETVCWHEYSHATINTIVKLNYSGESGAINEGQADYFACSMSDDPKLGEWAVAKMGKPYMRFLENKLHYPEDIGNEVHKDGEIWGATLWDVRKALGASVADLLIHKSFFYLKSGRPTFLDGYNAIMTADKNIFGGKNAAKITAVFVARGISKAGYDGEVLDKKDIKKIKAFKKAHGE